MAFNKQISWIYWIWSYFQSLHTLHILATENSSLLDSICTKNPPMFLFKMIWIILFYRCQLSCSRPKYSYKDYGTTFNWAQELHSWNIIYPWRDKWCAHLDLFSHIHLHLVFHSCLLVEPYIYNNCLEHVVAQTPLVLLVDGLEYRIEATLDFKVMCNRLWYLGG